MSTDLHKECVSHHHACPCREYRFAKMEDALIRLARFDIEPKYLANGHDEVARVARAALQTPPEPSTCTCSEHDKYPCNVCVARGLEAMANSPREG